MPSSSASMMARRYHPSASVAMEVLEQQHDLEQVRALHGHTRIDTIQIYATIRPAQLKRAVSFYEDKAARMLSESNQYLSPARNGDDRRRADGRWEIERESNTDGRGRKQIKDSEFKDVSSMSSNTEH